MTMVNIHEAKTHLSRLIKKVLNGEEVVIARGNKPVAKLIQYGPKKNKRQIGTAKGKVKLKKDFKAVGEDFREYME
jgi:prevent-host-death family protein